MNSVIIVSFITYMTIQFLGAFGVFLKYKQELMLTEKNDLYRDIFSAIFFLILGTYIYSNSLIHWWIKTPVWAILILIGFGIFQIRCKKIERNIDQGTINLGFIYYSLILTKFSGVLLIASGIFCLAVNSWKY